MAPRILAKCLVVLLLLAVIATTVFRARLEWRAPKLAAPFVLEVSPGDSIAAIARRLHAAGLIRDEALFATLAKWRRVDRRIRSGLYDIEGGAVLGEVLDHLVSGPQRQPLLVIPEGLNVTEVARLFEAAGFGPAAEFERLCRDPAVAKRLGVPAPGLEGYLFPDTYAFAKGTPPLEILATMTRRFWEVFTPALAADAAARGLSPTETVILASLIEEEAAVAEERPLISAVFHNRLARGMRLQSDPTAVYGFEREGPVRRSDIDRKSPYNTYWIRGLPPGPISNPGRASLEAAARPAEGVEALYFVARNDRTHEFTTNLRDHQRAVNRHLRRPRSTRGVALSQRLPQAATSPTFRPP